MPPKLDPNRPKAALGRPPNAERPVEITLKFSPSYARQLAALGKRHGYGAGHTEVARFLIMREVARLEELEATNPIFRDGLKE
jgi:hypothetical protein